MQLLGRRAIGADGPDTEAARVVHDYLWSFQYTIAAGHLADPAQPDRRADPRHAEGALT